MLDASILPARIASLRSLIAECELTLQELIPDDLIVKVHGYADFGPDTTPREVVNEGVMKYAVGYQTGHTAMTILREHGLITSPVGYKADLTAAGKKYAREVFQIKRLEQEVLEAELQLARSQASQRQSALHDLADAVTKIRDLLRESVAMQSREHIGLGIDLNRTLDHARIVLNGAARRADTPPAKPATAVETALVSLKGYTVEDDDLHLVKQRIEAVFDAILAQKEPK